jgi:drug/metabolite transporter (DMT)-like permease
MAFFVFLWAVIELLGSKAGVPALEVVWFRYATHLLVMLLVAGWRGKTGSLVRTREPLRWHILRSLTMLGMPLFFLASVRSLSISSTLAIFWSYPAILLTISCFVADYKLRVKDVLAAALGYAGVLAMLHPDRAAFGWNALLPLSMGFCFATYQILTRSLRADSHSVRLFHTALWVFLALSFYLPFVWQTPSWRGCAVMGAIGLLGWVGLYTLDLAMDSAPPAAYAGFAFLQPVWSAVLESALHGAPSGAQVAGILLIVAALGCYGIPGRAESQNSGSLASGVPRPAGEG